MAPARRARIERMAEKLGHQLDSAQKVRRRSEAPPTYCYVVVYKGKAVYHGISTDPRRRMAEHRARWPGATVEVISPAVTREAALEWRARLRAA